MWPISLAVCFTPGSQTEPERHKLGSPGNNLPEHYIIALCQGKVKYWAPHAEETKDYDSGLPHKHCEDNICRAGFLEGLGVIFNEYLICINMSCLTP